MSFDPPGVVGIVSSTLRSGFHACADAPPAARRKTIDKNVRKATRISPPLMPVVLLFRRLKPARRYHATLHAFIPMPHAKQSLVERLTVIQRLLLVLASALL